MTLEKGWKTLFILSFIPFFSLSLLGTLILGSLFSFIVTFGFSLSDLGFILLCIGHLTEAVMEGRMFSRSLIIHGSSELEMKSELSARHLHVDLCVSSLNGPFHDVFLAR